MIRLDSIQLTIEPMDIRGGTKNVLARVIEGLDAAEADCVYLVAIRRLGGSSSTTAWASSLQCGD